MNGKARTKYPNLRARLIERGTTLRRFAMENGLPVRSVYSAARGDRAGVKSVYILKKLEDFAYGK